MIRTIPWLLLALLACGASTGPTAVDATAYAAEQQACVDDAKDRAGADACRKASRDRFCARFPGDANCTKGTTP
jgi:hypothetical protein